LIFEGDGVIRDFPGNYSQYRASMVEQEQSAISNKRQRATGYPLHNNEKAQNREGQTRNLKKKLSYKEKREFDLLEKEIADLNTEKEVITKKFAEGGLSFEELQNLSQRIGEIAGLLDSKEMRWLELSEMTED